MSEQGVIIHSTAMKLGMSLAEYDRTVGPKNQLFHEIAEARLLNRQRVIPFDDEEQSSETTVKDPKSTRIRGSSEANFRDTRDKSVEDPAATD